MSKNYVKIQDIDEGAFGKVIKGKNIKTNEIVAIKVLKKKFLNWEECINLREVKSLRKLNHPNVIKLKEVFKIENELSLVFEYVNKNLYKLYTEDYRDKGKEMEESTIKSLIYQMASGLSYMHKNGFFHRDIKPENILVNEKLVTKIADLGLTREIRSMPPYTNYVGTRWYRSPEILLDSNNYNSPCDIFALGCIMAELYIFKPLFNGTNTLDQLNKIFQILGTPNKDWVEGYKLASKLRMNFQKYNPVNLKEIIPNASNDAIDLIKKMLEFDSQKRIKASQILLHPFFSKSIVYKGDYKTDIPLLKKNSISTKNMKKFDKIEFKNDNFQKNYFKKETDNWDDLNIEFIKKNKNNTINKKESTNSRFNDDEWDLGDDDWDTNLKKNFKNNHESLISSINVNELKNINNQFRTPLNENNFFDNKPNPMKINKSNRDTKKNLFDDPFLDEFKNESINNNNSYLRGLNVINNNNIKI